MNTECVLRACSSSRVVILLLPTKGVLVDVPLYVPGFGASLSPNVEQSFCDLRQS
jgi:hypothetical protein